MARPVPDEAQAILREAAKICRRLSAVDDQREEDTARRRALWAQAADAGASFPMIAESCGVSVQYVNKEVSKERGKPWATAK